MACNSRSSCGPDFEQMRLWLKGIILELLNDGTLQAGLKDCEGEWLGKARNVVLCDKLADLLCDLINEGKLCVPKIAGFTADCDTKTLTITMADGTELTVDASCFGGSGADGNTKIQSFTYDPQTGVVKIVDTENREFGVTIAVNDTKNKAMAWEPDKQEVSVTDTDDNKVSAVVTFPVAERPPVSQGSAPTQFIGKSGELFLGEPAVWMRMLLPDGRVGRMPVFLEDQIIRACQPFVWHNPETGGAIDNIINANAYKVGDSLAAWADRNNRIAPMQLSYAPDKLSTEKWREFGEHIYNWLVQNEGPNINTNLYYVYINTAGYVPLRALLGIEPQGVLIIPKFFHAYSEDEAMEIYSVSNPYNMGISGEDGNIYSPPNPECGIIREPDQGYSIPMWVSLSYTAMRSGTITELLVSDKETITGFPKGRYLRASDAFWNDIFAAAQTLKTTLEHQYAVRWEADPAGHLPHVVAINTPFGSLDVQGTFDFAEAKRTATGTNPYDENKVVKEATHVKGTVGEAETATKFPFYKTDEIRVEDDPGNRFHKHVVFDGAKKNMLQLYKPKADYNYLLPTLSSPDSKISLATPYFGNFL